MSVDRPNTSFAEYLTFSLIFIPTKCCFLAIYCTFCDLSLCFIVLWQFIYRLTLSFILTYFLQVPHKLCCAHRAAAVRNLGCSCPRQLYGAGAYGMQCRMADILILHLSWCRRNCSSSKTAALTARICHIAAEQSRLGYRSLTAAGPRLLNGRPLCFLLWCIRTPHQLHSDYRKLVHSRYLY